MSNGAGCSIPNSGLDHLFTGKDFDANSGADQACSIATTASGTGAIANTASVASSTTDPTPGNHVGTVSLGGVPAAVRAVPTTGTMALWLLALPSLGAGLLGFARRH
jgi:hypothetical protein